MDQMFSLRICHFSIRITLIWGQLRNSRHQRKSQYSVFLPKSRTEIYLSKGVPPPFFRRGQWPSNTEDNSTLLVEIAPTLVCIINRTKQHLSFISFHHIFTSSQFTAQPLEAQPPFSWSCPLSTIHCPLLKWYMALKPITSLDFHFILFGDPIFIINLFLPIYQLPF